MELFLHLIFCSNAFESVVLLKCILFTFLCLVQAWYSMLGDAYTKLVIRFLLQPEPRPEHNIKNKKEMKQMCQYQLYIFFPDPKNFGRAGVSLDNCVAYRRAINHYIKFPFMIISKLVTDPLGAGSAKLSENLNCAINLSLTLLWQSDL